ncbi:MAG: 1-acyl-sn-glycerol-3-phosphate acyltransferase [Tannerella sp.]|jgi:putative hemolysin|nr:1-acyl-sn-glycerol-3-phosphate acyltransferase [Tannerella sp.]
MEMQIDVKQVLRSKLKDKADKIPKFVVNYLIRIIHQDEINEILRRYKDLQGVGFMEALVEDYFKVELNIKQEENLPPPGEKKYIFVSNHPLGGFDGICLSYFIGKRYNNKVKYFVNDLLLAIPNLRSIFVPINKHGSQSRDAVKKMEEAYQSDNQIITFPAGLCSRKHKGVIGDLEWKKSFIQKAIEHKRDVVPIYFEGRNSNFFYRLANIRAFFNIKMNLEMLYLPDELFKQKNKSFGIHIGKPVSWQTFDSGKKTGEWAVWMKNEVYKLADK